MDSAQNESFRQATTLQHFCQRDPKAVFTLNTTLQHKDTAFPNSFQWDRPMHVVTTFAEDLLNPTQQPFAQRQVKMDKKKLQHFLGFANIL